MTSGLGNYTSNVSPEKLSESRYKRQLLKEHAGSLLPSNRVAWCMHRLSIGESDMILCGSESKHKSSMRHVALCGSIWTCPVCSARITEQRRLELARALESAYLPVMITFTLQHDREEQLSDLLEALRDSFRRLKSGKAWMSTKEKYAIKAYVTALEVMYGSGSGWHPHLHMLVWCDLKASNFDASQLQQELFERYQKLLSKHGKYALSEYGLKVQACSGKRELHEYISKFGMQFELSKSASKIGKEAEHWTPFQLLEMSMNGNKQASKLYCDYAKAMAGRKQLTWSQHAREILGMDKELTDEQIVAQLDAQEPDDTKELLRFGKSAFKKLVSKRLIPELLRVADSCNVELILCFLELHGFDRIEVEVCT